MNIKERIYFLIGLFASLAGLVTGGVLMTGYYEPETKLIANTPLCSAFGWLLALSALFLLSGLWVLKKGSASRRMPAPNGGVMFFGSLTGLFVLAIFILTLYTGRGAVTNAIGTAAAQAVSRRIVFTGLIASSVFCSGYFLCVSILRRVHHAVAGLLGVGAMLWCIFYTVSVYFDMTYALSSPVRILNMLCSLCMLMYLTAEIRFFLHYAKPHQYFVFSFLLILFACAYSIPRCIYDFVLGVPTIETVAALTQLSAALYALCRLISFLKNKEPASPEPQEEETEMEYTFAHYEYLSDVDWDKVDKAMIDHYGWGYPYQPLCYARGVFADDTGLVVKLTAFEKNPRATRTEFMDDVCNDSCMEFFFSADKVAYANFEFNSLGTQHTSAGAPGARASIDKITEIPFDKAEIFEDRWELTLILTHKNVKDITGKELKRGARFYGNFYKCGDECEQKHYGMWSEVKTEKPSFHQPAYFGTFIIG